MNKLALILILASLAACSSKPKLEAPECPAAEKGGTAVNQEGAAPVVWDDGHFTFIRFGQGQDIPKISALRPDGRERHIDSNFNPNTKVATVFGIYPTLVLRSEKRVACIRNGAYDPYNPQAKNTIVRDDGAIW